MSGLRPFSFASRPLRLTAYRPARLQVAFGQLRLRLRFRALARLRLAPFQANNEAPSVLARCGWAERNNEIYDFARTTVRPQVPRRGRFPVGNSTEDAAPDGAA